MDLNGALSAFGGAGFGAWLAFRFQEKHETKKQKRVQLNAGVLTLLMLEEYHQILQSIRSEYLSGPGHPNDRWYTALCRISPASLTFEPAKLDFLIKRRPKGLIRDLVIARNRFEKCIELLNARHDKYYQVQNQVVSSGKGASVEDMSSVEAVNEILKFELDAALTLIPMVAEELELSLQTEFPKAKVSDLIDMGENWRKGDLIKEFVMENSFPISWFDRVKWRVGRFF